MSQFSNHYHATLSEISFFIVYLELSGIGRLAKKLIKYISVAICQMIIKQPSKVYKYYLT